MALRHAGFIDLPAHQKTGGFDHAAVHLSTRTLYIAHTANDSVDIVDLSLGRYSHSIADLPGVAGVLVSNETGLVFTSNREEETVGIFQNGKEGSLQKVRVGGKPNGLAYDPSTGLLLAANVSRPGGVGGVTISIVNVKEKVMVADVMVPGRTRWTVYDPDAEKFYVNVAQPAQIMIVDARDPDGTLGHFSIPATGPHGLELDRKRRRLYCACDEGGLFAVDLESKKVSKVSDLSGTPDVIFHNSNTDHLYVTIGMPGVIEVFDTGSMKMVQVVKTEPGTHTIAFDEKTGRVYAFMPETHRASVYVDE